MIDVSVSKPLMEITSMSSL